MGLRIMLVSETKGRASTLAKILEDTGHEVIRSAPDDDLANQLTVAKAELLVLETNRPSKPLIDSIRELSTTRPCPIVLFTVAADIELMEESTRAGVNAYVVNGIDAARITPIIDVALVRFEQLRHLQHELEKTRESLAERKIVERAKGLLMKQKRCSENDAYHLLRKMAMKQNTRLADVARSVVSIEELLS